MAQPNKHLDNAIEDYYRNQAMQIVIHTFIVATKHWIPSITLEESAQACIKMYDLDEGLYSRETVISTYYRVSKDLTDLKKHKNTLKAFPIKV